MNASPPPNLRWAKLAIAVGALLLAAAAALVVWDAADDSPPPPVITGRDG